MVCGVIFVNISSYAFLPLWQTYQRHIKVKYTDFLISEYLWHFQCYQVWLLHICVNITMPTFLFMCLHFHRLLNHICETQHTSVKCICISSIWYSFLQQLLHPQVWKLDLARLPFMSGHLLYLCDCGPSICRISQRYVLKSVVLGYQLYTWNIHVFVRVNWCVPDGLFYIRPNWQKRSMFLKCYLWYIFALKINFGWQAN